MSILEISAAQFEKLLLILLRVGGIMTVSPIFGHRNIPMQVRIGLAGIMTIILLPVVPAAQSLFPDSMSLIAVTAFKEVTTGLMVGFTAMVLFMAVQMSGHIMGFQMGFMVAQVIDPSTSQNVSILGQLQFILASLIFLAIDGHHLLLNAVAQSFQIIPLGQVIMTGASGEMLIRICIDIFAVALKIGAPMVITLFLTDVALGIIARTVPQMNVFIVGFPLKISAGFLTLAASFPFITYVLTKLMQGMDRELSDLIYALAGRS